MNTVTLTQDQVIALFALLAQYSIALIFLVVVAIIANWKLFTKAGEAGWKCLIPIYGQYVMYKIVWSGAMFWLMLILSAATYFLLTVNTTIALILGIIELILYIVAQYNTAKAYGHGGGYTLGLIFLPFIFLLILAFGSSQYCGPKGEGKTY